MEDQQPEEIRKNAHSWNLEGDAKLLKFMQKISENLEKRCSATKDKLNNMVLNLDFTSVELGNTINQLSALENLQFVENRISEDDGAVFAKTKIPNNIEIENSNYNPIETLTTVLKNCNKMIDECFEQVSIDIEDSDDEDGTLKSIALRPKKTLQSQRAPFIIGSIEWFDKWHVGLCDSDENFSDEENNDEFSESSDSVSIEGSLPSIAPTISESECSVWGLHQRTNMYRMTSSSDDVSTNTATSKGSLEDPCNSGQQKVLSKQPKAPPLFLPQDTNNDRYYVHKPNEDLFANNGDDDSDGDMFENKKPAYIIPHDKRISNIISDEPPELDEVDRKSKDVSNSLFYDSDENNYPVRSSSKKKPTDTAEISNNTETRPATSNIRKKTVNLFDDDDFDSFMKELDTKTLQKSNAKAETADTVKNLFNDDMKDDITISIPKTTSTAPDLSSILKGGDLINSERRKEIRDVKNLFEDDTDDDNDLIPTPRKINTVIKPVNRKPVNPVIRKDKKLFDDDDDDDNEESDIFNKKLEKTNSAQNLPKISSKTSNIFNSESEDEPSFINIKPKKNQEPKISSLGKANLADDRFITEKVDTLPPKTGTNKTTIFDDDPLDDDFDSLFSTSNKISVGGNTESDQKPISKPNIPATPSPTITHQEKNLVKEESDRNLYISDQKSKPIQKKANLFDDDSDSDDLFASKVNEPFKTQKTDTKSSPIFEKTSKNIFGEDDEDEEADNLFSNLSKSKSIPSDKSDNGTETIQIYNEVPTARSLITDLFNDEQPEDDDILQTKSSLNPSISDTILSATIEKISEQNGINSNLENIEKVHIDDNDKEIESVPSSEKVILEEEKQIKENDHFDISLGKDSDETIANDENLSDGEIIFDSKSSIINHQDEQKKTGLQLAFLEDPPPDIFIANSSESNDDAPENSKNSPVNLTPSGYDPLSLFDDIPPDDDFQTTSDVTKRLHTIFYDDFSDTIVPQQIPISKSPSNYIFNDEPPPDNDSTLPNISNDFENKEDITLPAAIENVVQPIEFERKNLKFDIPQDVAVKKSKPIPRKLNVNLNINVAALLPGAKQPKFKEDKNLKVNDDTQNVSPNTSLSITHKDDNKATIDTTPKNINITSDPKRLSSLNKTRAKIQVRRKPSTRKARQENYRKSLDTNGSFLDSSEENNVARIEDEMIAKEEIDEKPKTEIVSRLEEKLPTKASSSAHLLFASDNDDDDEENTDWLSTATKASVKSVSSVSNDIPVSNVNVDTTSSSETQKEAHSSKKISLFDDEHSDDDDLFSSKFSNKKSPIKNDVSRISVKITNKNEEKSNLKNQSNSIFPDENENSFKTNSSSKLNSTVNNQNNTVPVKDDLRKVSIKSQSHSIFGSDDDDDDEELFAKALKNAKPLRSSQFKSKENTKKSLFDDVDDDDDDLFGNAGVSKAKNEGNARPYKSTVTSRPVEKKTLNPETSNNNNPLADLLDS